jgi:hypothetical protein
LLVVNEKTLGAKTNLLIFTDVLDSLAWMIGTRSDSVVSDGSVLFKLLHVGEDILHHIELKLRVWNFS